MNARRVQELMEKARSDEPIDDAEFGTPRLTDEPIEVDDEVMIGKSVRMSLAMLHDVGKLADTQGVDFSKLVRRWIEEGYARETGQQVDPIGDLERAVARIRTAFQRARAA